MFQKKPNKVQNHNLTKTKIKAQKQKLKNKQNKLKQPTHNQCFFFFSPQFCEGT